MDDQSLLKEFIQRDVWKEDRVIRKTSERNDASNQYSQSFFSPHPTPLSLFLAGLLLSLFYRPIFARFLRDQAVLFGSNFFLFELCVPAPLPSPLLRTLTSISPPSLPPTPIHPLFSLRSL